MRLKISVSFSILGCEIVDQVEQIAIDRAKTLFNAAWVNVQPHSGAQANAAVMLGVIQPGDTILGFDLSHGGHLTHGSSVNFSGPVLEFLNLISKNHLTIGVLIIVSLCLVISIVAFLHWMWYGKARIVGISSAVVFGLVFVQILAMIFLQIRNW